MSEDEAMDFTAKSIHTLRAAPPPNRWGVRQILSTPRIGHAYNAHPKRSERGVTRDPGALGISRTFTWYRYARNAYGLYPDSSSATSIVWLWRTPILFDRG